MEGVMMRGETSMATAVRDADGLIRLETKRVKSSKKRCWFLRLPIIRGVVNFISSLIGGIGILMRSSEVYGEGEPSKFEKWLAKTFHLNIMSVVGTIALIFALFLAVALFIYLPVQLANLLDLFPGVSFSSLGRNLTEGVFKILIFVLYIIFCSLIKDVKRTFMYHGAEHKTISCYEQGLEMTIENARKCKRVHDRCGTTFIVFVMLISILTFALFEHLLNTQLTLILRVACKIALLPLVAGLSYELLKGLAKTKCFIFYPIKLPGLLLQKITTKEPDDSMLEVAITAFNKVLEMDADQSIAEVDFEFPISRINLTDKVFDILSKNNIDEKAESEWIVSLTLNIKRDQVYSSDIVSVADQRKVLEVVNKRCTGRPLWYCIGDTDFYGYKIFVDERVLIPRPETELLVEKAIEYINQDSSVLDLCTGSGAIAIAVKKQTNANVVASDVSQEALTLAKHNANFNNANIEFIQSDLFENLSDYKFDVIITNPPYIKSSDILELQKEVKDFEPQLALDGGEDGLYFYKKIIENCKKHLNKNGIILFECGFDQALVVAGLCKDFSDVSIIKDLENIDRIVKAVC